MIMLSMNVYGSVKAGKNMNEYVENPYLLKLKSTNNDDDNKS